MLSAETEDLPGDGGDLTSVTYLLVAAVLWGSTNPFLRKGAKDVDCPKTLERKNALPFPLFLTQLIETARNWKVSLPFIINQCGSLFFYFGLAGSRVSFAVPFTNSLTFVFTTLTGFCLGEFVTKRHIVGMISVIAGICICTAGYDG